MFKENLPILPVRRAIGLPKETLPEQQPEGAEEEDAESEILQEGLLPVYLSPPPRARL